MRKNAVIGAFAIVIIILVAAFLMRGPSQPVGTGATPPSSTSDTTRPAVTSPPPPATAPSN